MFENSGRILSNRDSRTRLCITAKYVWLLNFLVNYNVQHWPTASILCFLVLNAMDCLWFLSVVYSHGYFRLSRPEVHLCRWVELEMTKWIKTLRGKRKNIDVSHSAELRLYVSFIKVFFAEFRSPEIICMLSSNCATRILVVDSIWAVWVAACSLDEHSWTCSMNKKVESLGLTCHASTLQSQPSFNNLGESCAFKSHVNLSAKEWWQVRKASKSQYSGVNVAELGQAMTLVNAYSPARPAYVHRYL